VNGGQLEGTTATAWLLLSTEIEATVWSGQTGREIPTIESEA
jgi:hypothetical protein